MKEQNELMKWTETRENVGISVAGVRCNRRCDLMEKAAIGFWWYKCGPYAVIWHRSLRSEKEATMSGQCSVVP